MVHTGVLVARIKVYIKSKTWVYLFVDVKMPIIGLNTPEILELFRNTFLIILIFSLALMVNDWESNEWLTYIRTLTLQTTGSIRHRIFVVKLFNMLVCVESWFLVLSVHVVLSNLIILSFIFI
jgi:hypothetical protein